MANRTYHFPRMQFLRVPMCCSAGNIYGINTYTTFESVDTTKNVQVTTKEFGDFEKFGALRKVAYFNEQQVMTALGLLLSYRVVESKNPFNLEAFEHFNAQTPEPGRYEWPSKVWTMYDRTDLPKEGLNTRAFGEWLVENGESMGITMTIVDCESVHAIHESYSNHGSDKPNGYGTIRVYNISVTDTDKMRKWYERELKKLVSNFNFIHQHQPGATKEKISW